MIIGNSETAADSPCVLGSCSAQEYLLRTAASVVCAFKVALRLPTLVGVNVTEKLQLLPGFTFDEQVVV